MGSELSCPCAGKTMEPENTPKPQTETQSINLKARFEESDILYNYNYGLTKINLIKTSNLEKFFNCRSLLKLGNRKEGNDYYDKIFIANYMGNKEITAIIMQYTQGARKSTTEARETKTKRRVPDYNAKYSIEDLVLFTNDKDKNIVKLNNDLNNNIKKNQTFLGLVTDSDSTNKTYKMLYKTSLTNKSSIEYIVDVYDEEFNEDSIEEFLNNRANKRSILKSILVDRNNEMELTDTSTTSPTSSSSKNFKDSNLKESATYYLIFEDDPTDQNYYDYNVIKMKKDNSNKDGYIKDLIPKLNDFQQAFILTNFFSDESSIYFFMIMPINMTPSMNSFM